MEQKRNIPVIIGILIPIAMVLFVAGSIYLPRSFAEKPTHDFVYILDPYWGGVRFSVVNGVLTEKVLPPSEDEKFPIPREEARIFVHDIDTNTSREVELSEAAKLKLDSKLQSPDGFTVTQGNGGGDFFPFFGGGGDYNSRYIQGKGYQERLNIFSDREYFYGNFQFMGWVIP